MNPTVSAITLGVDDVDRARAFYERGLGCRVQQQADGYAALGVDGVSTAVALYRVDALAADAGVPADGRGFRGAALSFIVAEAAAVDAVVASAQTAGGSVIKPARSQLWGGYSAYVADTDGHLWKVASNHRPPLLRGKRDAATPTSVPTPTETAVILACRDVKQSKAFYADGLGFLVDKSYGKFVSFKTDGEAMQLTLYAWDSLADDAGVNPDGNGFRAMTLSYHASSADEVDEVLEAAARAGAATTDPTPASWGGYSGHFTDPSGHIWKVASRA